MADTEQNKTEQPTAFKLKRAREKGTVARGSDIGFFSALLGLALFTAMAGAHLIRTLAETMQQLLRVATVSAAINPHQTPSILAVICAPALNAILSFSGVIVLVVGFFELVQLRGLMFAPEALKPDFNRLNPAKGLKRVVSLRMLKETAKNVAKVACYAGAAWLVTRNLLNAYGASLSDAASLTGALKDSGLRLLYAFIVIALVFALLDQVIVRQEFQKQMRMSRSEVSRETKDREGDPRIKRKRKQLHAEFTKQARSLGDLTGSDMLIVNPDHYAVGLAYNAKTMTAPSVVAKGRNTFALLLKRRAAVLSIPIFEAPPLARALYRGCDKGQEVPSAEYRAVVDLYLKLPHSNWRQRGEANA